MNGSWVWRSAWGVNGFVPVSSGGGIAVGAYFSWPFDTEDEALAKADSMDALGLYVTVNERTAA